MSINRYDPDADGFGNYFGMKREDNGAYVLHDEHAERVLVLSRQQHETANRLDNADARIAELTADVGRYKEVIARLEAMAFAGRLPEDFVYIEKIARNALREGK